MAIAVFGLPLPWTVGALILLIREELLLPGLPVVYMRQAIHVGGLGSWLETTLNYTASTTNLCACWRSERSLVS
jgi:hypothetical protein